MYAAAGGASLASRQARQRQRQNKNKQQVAKATATTAQQIKDIKAPPLHQAKQYHNYTDDQISLSQLSRVERGALLRAPPQSNAHERRHSTSNYHLNEPLSSKHRLRESPSISIPVQIKSSAGNQHHPHHPNEHHHAQAPYNHVTESQQHPHHHGPHHRSHHATGTATSASSFSLHLPQIFIPEEGLDKLERRCSFVRQVEEVENQQQGLSKQEKSLLDKCNHLCNYEIKSPKIWEDSAEYDCLSNSIDYPFSECSQGRAAWQERERQRRCSLLDESSRQHRIKQSEAHHRWMKRNRIHDSTIYGGGSEDDDDNFLRTYHQSAAANALLYVGLGTTAIGCVIFFVGTGEKGFKTLELRLIGPTLVACGLLCCLIRVLLCACACSSCSCLLLQHQKSRKKKKEERKKEGSGGGCPYNSSRYPLQQKSSHPTDFHSTGDNSALLGHQYNNNSNSNSKKKVCIAPVRSHAPALVPPAAAAATAAAAPPTSTSCVIANEIINNTRDVDVVEAVPEQMTASNIASCFNKLENKRVPRNIPEINLPGAASEDLMLSQNIEEDAEREEEEELRNFESHLETVPYEDDLESVSSSCEGNSGSGAGSTVILCHPPAEHTTATTSKCALDDVERKTNFFVTSETRKTGENSQKNNNDKSAVENDKQHQPPVETQPQQHSEIVLCPLQLGQ